MPTRSKVKTVNRKKAAAKKRAPKKKAPSRRGRKARRNPDISFDWRDTSIDEIRSYETRVDLGNGYDAWGAVYIEEEDAGDPLIDWEIHYKVIPSGTMEGDESWIDNAIYYEQTSEKSLAKGKEWVEKAIKAEIESHSPAGSSTSETDLESALDAFEDPRDYLRAVDLLESGELTKKDALKMSAEELRAHAFEVANGMSQVFRSIRVLYLVPDVYELVIDHDEKGEPKFIREGALQKRKKYEPESESEKIRKRGVEAKDPAIAEFFRSFKDEPSDSSEVFLEDILRRKDRGDIGYWPNPKKKRKPKKKTKAKKKRSQKRRARKNPYGVEEFRTDLDDGNYKIEYDNGDVLYFDENARLHRLGGPAAIYPDGHKEYWIHGQRFYDEDSFKEEAGWGNHQNIGGSPTPADGTVITSLPNGGTKEVYPYGKIVYKDASGELHREGGPAVVFSSGTKHYHDHGKLHREGGPAIITADGTKKHYDHGNLHREGGPAVTWADGTKEYWLNGNRHREGGPAIVRPDGTKEYWLDGVEYTEEGWKEEMLRRRGDVSEPEPEPDPVGDSAKLAEWELQKKRMDKRSQEILGSDLPELLYEYPGDVDLWEKYKDPHDNPKKKRRRKKKRTSARKKTTARDLIAACRKHWDAYCEKPNKTNLKKVFKHLEKMAESTAKTVKDERRKCLRVAKLEAKELKLNI